MKHHVRSCYVTLQIEQSDPSHSSAEKQKWDRKETNASTTWMFESHWCGNACWSSPSAASWCRASSPAAGTGAWGRRWWARWGTTEPPPQSTGTPPSWANHEHSGRTGRRWAGRPGRTEPHTFKGTVHQKGKFSQNHFWWTAEVKSSGWDWSSESRMTSEELKETNERRNTAEVLVLIQWNNTADDS